MHVVESESVGLGGYFISASESYTMSDDDICFELLCLINFVGQTEEGIRIGDPLADVETAYGPPDDNLIVGAYWYSSLGIVFFHDYSENVERIGVYSPYTLKSTYEIVEIREELNKMELDLRK